ncbi:hypothetical protein FRB90_012461 [Tulasnella sp. 427]|nr:hypothetical protein FRB90_012461 [Tulasnella sp. 427]
MSVATSPSHGVSLFSDERCSICDQGLVVAPEDLAESSYLDDVELSCTHHFHWTCYAEWEEDESRGKCPLCGESSLDQRGRLIVIVRNEGGTTQGFDLGEALDLESEMDAHPQRKRERAFLEMIASKDYETALALLTTFGDDEEKEPPVDVNCLHGDDAEPAIVRGKTALHVCAMSDDADGISWLLRFGADRTVQDVDGRTPLEYAERLGNARAKDALSASS